MSEEETCSLSEDECGHETNAIISYGVTHSKEERLENVFKLWRKLIYDLKGIDSLKVNLHV